MVIKREEADPEEYKKWEEEQKSNSDARSINSLHQVLSLSSSSGANDPPDKIMERKVIMRRNVSFSSEGSVAGFSAPRIQNQLDVLSGISSNDKRANEQAL